MTKRFFLFVAILCIATTSFSSVPVPAITPAVDPQPLVDIGYNVRIPIDKLAELTPKEYRKLTGHRLGFFKSIALKIAQKKMKNEGTAGTKSQVAAALLCFFLGVLGIHRFYLGYTWQGIVQLLTAGGFGIWALIDLIRIITGDLKPKNGEYKSKM